MVEISLRGDGPWQGLTDESEQAPTSGRFLRLNGCYVSRDGSEIVRFPGIVLAAEPGYAEGPYQASFTSVATFTDITSSGAVPLGPNAGNFMNKNDGATQSTFVFTENVSLDNSLTDGFHSSEYEAQHRVRITTTTTGASTGTPEKIWIHRLGALGALLPIHDLIDCLGVPVILFESQVFYDASKAATPVDTFGVFRNKHLAALVAHKPFDIDNPLQPNEFSYWPSAALKHLFLGVKYARETGNLYELDGVQYDPLRIKRKVNLELYDGRVIVSAPGYGCMFEVNLKDHQHEHFDGIDEALTQAGTTNALGIPQGVAPATEPTWGPSGEVPNGATIFYAIAYYNGRTGEFGRLSKIRQATAPSTGGPFTTTIAAPVPHMVLRETDADTVMVFASANDGEGSAVALAPKVIKSWGPKVLTLSSFLSENPLKANLSGPHEQPAGQFHVEVAGQTGGLPSIEGSRIAEAFLSIDDSYPDTNQNATQTFGDATTIGVAQSFTGAGNKLRRIQVDLARVGNPTGTINAKIWAHSGVFGTTSVPSGVEPIGVSQPLNVETLGGTLTVTDIDFVNGPTLVAATKYVLALHLGADYVGSAPDHVIVGTDTTAPSHAGNISTFVAGWVADATRDMIFFLLSETAQITFPGIDGSSQTITGTPTITYHHFPTVEATWATSPLLAVTTLPPPLIPQLPQGSLFARTAKGHLFTGGRIASNESTSDSSIDGVKVQDQPVNQVFRVLESFGQSAKGIPSGYTGNFARNTNFLKKGRLLALSSMEAGPPMVEFWDYAGESGGSTPNTDRVAEILLQKGHVQYSPKERPGEMPAINRIVFDRRYGRDVIAAANFGDDILFMTDRETFLLRWGRNPLGADPYRISTQFGAISPVVVETDMGPTWLSHRGPVIYRGGAEPEWIGRAVAHRFRDDKREPNAVVRGKRYLRDSQGMMFHARAVHDRVRKIVYWYLRSDRVNTAFADAAVTINVTGTTATNPIVFTVDESLGIGRDEQFPVTISGNSAGAPINRAWRGKAINHNTFSVPFDNSGGSVPGNGAANYEFDGAKSKVGNDEVLAWSYGTGTFSTWEHPDDMKWVGAAEASFSDGVTRPVLVTDEKSVIGSQFEVEVPGAVWAVEEEAYDRLKEPVVRVTTVGPSIIPSGPTAGTYFVSNGVDFRTLLRHRTDGANPLKCVYQAYIKNVIPDENGNTVLDWWGHIDGILSDVFPDSLRIVTPAGMPVPTWGVGAKIVIGVIHMEMETTSVSLVGLSREQRDLRRAWSCAGLVLEHTIRKFSTQTDPAEAWCFAEVSTRGALTKLHPEAWGHPLETGRGISRVFGGAAKGRELALKMTIVGMAEVHLKDIRLEVTEGG